MLMNTVLDIEYSPLGKVLLMWAMFTITASFMDSNNSIHNKEKIP